MIIVSENAAKRIQDYAARVEPDKKNLRISVLSGGCSGLQYKFEFVPDSAITKDDYIVEEHGVKVVIDPKSAIYLAGTQLDYYDTLMQSGFKMSNPNAKSTCSCGESFGV